MASHLQLVHRPTPMPSAYVNRSGNSRFGTQVQRTSLMRLATTPFHANRLFGQDVRSGCTAEHLRNYKGARCWNGWNESPGEREAREIKRHVIGSLVCDRVLRHCHFSTGTVSGSRCVSYQ